MDSGICQTSTASPAEPGGLPFVLASRGLTCFEGLALGRKENVLFAGFGSIQLLLVRLFQQTTSCGPSASTQIQAMVAS